MRRARARGRPARPARPPAAAVSPRSASFSPVQAAGYGPPSCARARDKRRRTRVTCPDRNTVASVSQACAWLSSSPRAAGAGSRPTRRTRAGTAAASPASAAGPKAWRQGRARPAAPPAPGRRSGDRRARAPARGIARPRHGRVSRHPAEPRAACAGRVWFAADVAADFDHLVVARRHDRQAARAASTHKKSRCHRAPPGVRVAFAMVRRPSARNEPALRLQSNRGGSRVSSVERRPARVDRSRSRRLTPPALEITMNLSTGCTPGTSTWPRCCGSRLAAPVDGHGRHEARDTSQSPLLNLHPQRRAR